MFNVIFNAPDRRGLCAVSAHDRTELDILRLVPGVTWDALQRRLLAPVNLQPPQAAVNLTVPARLRQYQAEAVEFIEQSKLGCIVADDVGLGKTRVVCEYLARHVDLRPVLIVGPLIAAGAWCDDESDPRAVYNLRVVPLRGTSPDLDGAARGAVETFGRRPDGWFINYDILQDWLPALKLGLDPKVLVFDEAHTLRNPRTQAGRAAHQLCASRTVMKRVLLSATPVVNHVIDLWSQLDCAQPKLWGPMVPYNEKMLTSFGTRYAGATHNGYGWQYGSETNVSELTYRLRSVLIRRSRFDARKELPAFGRQRVTLLPDALEREAAKRYATAAGGLRSDWQKELVDGAAGLTRLTELCSELSWSKRDVAVRQALALARSTHNGKLLVYTWYKRTAQYICKALKKEAAVYGPVTGETQLEKRLQLAAAFKESRESGLSVFVATLGSAGISLNPLAAASAALFVDLYWVPAVLLQAEGRIHREGQQASSVLVQYLVAKGTVDDVLFSVLEKKSKTIAAALKDAAASSLCETLGGRDERSGVKALLDDLAALSDFAMELK